MSTLFDCGLMAQVNNLDGFVSALRDKKGRMESGEMLAGMLILVAILAAVWVLARILDLNHRKRSYVSPRGLLWSLSRAHRLRWSQWWLLSQIARHQGLSDPARLFLEPERLDPANLGPQFEPRRLQIQVLRARLFADLAEMSGQHGPAAASQAPVAAPACSDLSS